MLILTRRIGEEIMIGDELIRILLMDVKGHQVRLGFTASKDLPIHRLEIYDKIQANAEMQKKSRWHNWVPSEHPQ